VNLTTALNTYSITKTINSGASLFYSLKSFTVACNSTKISFYVIDNSDNDGQINIFDDNWKFLKSFYISKPNYMIEIKNVEIIISTSFGIFSLNQNFDFIRFSDDYSFNYGKLYYNETADNLLACSNSYPRIDIFNSSLRFIKSISTVPYIPTDIDVYDNLLFVATNTSLIFVYENGINIWNITTNFCSSIISQLFDDNGNIAVLCISNVIYVYSVNGSYLGMNWTSPVPELVDILFDSKDNLVLVNSNGLFIMSNKTMPTNSLNVSIDDSCIAKSEFNDFNIYFN
jgi:hypothetical protein